MVFNIQREKGKDPKPQQQVPSPQEKRPGRHAREALLFFSRPIICRVCGSVRSSPKGIPRSCLSALHDMASLPTRYFVRCGLSYAVDSTD